MHINISAVKKKHISILILLLFRYRRLKRQWTQLINKVGLEGNGLVRCLLKQVIATNCACYYSNSSILSRNSKRGEMTAEICLF